MQGRVLWLLFAVGLFACAREDAPAVELFPLPSSPGASSQLSIPQASSSSGPPMPGPYRNRQEAALTLNTGCVGCHADEARQWQGSHHQMAFQNPAFQQALAIEPTAFCRGCHAPEADPKADPPARLGALGVACVSCHVTEEGAVLAAHHAGKEGTVPKSEQMPHTIRRSAEFSQTGGCAGCHEFHFPALSGDSDALMMQTTIREHRRSKGASTSCADCHMPLIDGKRSHGFTSVRDPAWLRKNLEAKVDRRPDEILEITLSQPSPGHGFPTGDLFRRLSVGCELRDAQGKVLKRDIQRLTRQFEIAPGQAGRVLTRDNRVFNEPVTVDLDIVPPSSGPRPAKIVWWIDYERVATVGEGVNPDDALIESSVQLYSGSLAW